MSDHGWADETVRHSVVAAGALYEWMRGAASDISAAEDARLILVPGGYDERAPELAAKIYKHHQRPGRQQPLVTTGAQSATAKNFAASADAPGQWVTEADHFATVIQRAGVPPEQIKRDTRVTYLREGVEAAARIAYANEIGLTRVVAICKPSLTRRVVEEFRATTSLTVPVLCPNLTFEEAMRGPFDQASCGPQGLSPRVLLNTLVNDAQKTLALAQDEPPAKVRLALNDLLLAGYGTRPRSGGEAPVVGSGPLQFAADTGAPRVARLGAAGYGSQASAAIRL